MKDPVQKDTSNFAEGSVFSRLMSMTVPMTAALLVNILYSVVDRIYIGHIAGIGELALTGIGLVSPIVTIIVAVQNLFGIGGSPIFSISRGRGRDDEAAQVLHNACFMLLITGALLTAAIYVFKDRMLWLIGASEDTFGLADDYLSIYAAGTVFVMFSLGLNPYINAQGDVRIGMLTVALGAVANIILDPIFIFAFGLGIKGAAIATVIAQFCSAVWVFLYFNGAKVKVKLRLRGFKPNLGVIGKIAALGVTEFVFQFTNAAVLVLYNSELQKLGGDIWVACLTVVYSVREITTVIVIGITGAAKPILGYNYGARCYSRTKETIKLMMIMCLGYMIFIWALIMLFPSVFIVVFNSDSKLLETGSVSLRLFFSLYFFGALQMCSQTVFVSLGKAKQALFFSMLRKVILLIPLAVLLPRIFGLGTYGVFLAEPASELIGGSICCFVMVKTVWKKLETNIA